jgi:deazaflavin-dependent oxidoreductase (nitroreductase family)
MPPPDFATASFCYLTTRGRITGRDHTIEIWFAAQGSTLYLLSGGGLRSDWVRNIRDHPQVTVRIGDQVWPGTASIVESPAECAAAADLVFAKYQPDYGGDLTAWRAAAVPVAVQLESERG